MVPIEGPGDRAVDQGAGQLSEAGKAGGGRRTGGASTDDNAAGRSSVAGELGDPIAGGTLRRPRMLAAILAVFLVMVLFLAACGTRGSPGTGAPSSVAKDKSVTIAVVSGWIDDIAISYLWKELLEQRGYTVTIKKLAAGAAFAGVAEGSADAYMAMWLPVTHGSYWEKYKDQLHKVTAFFDQDKLLLAVPKYVQADSLADLNEYAEKFNNKIVGIEAGAGEMRLLRNKVMPAYGLTDSYTLQASSTPAMLSALSDAIKDKSPIVVALWKPHWAFAKYPIKGLTDPKSAWPAAEKTWIVTNGEFHNTHPQVVEWFSHTQLTEKQFQSLMLQVHKAKTGNIARGVGDWLEENHDVVDGWFTQK